MISKFLNVFRIEELRKKLIFTSSLLLVYRLGGMVPLPGVDSNRLNLLTQSITGNGEAGSGIGILNLYDVFVGGFLQQASIFALGIMPYISASIILQLLGAVLPYYQRLQKEGELGRRKITAHTRYFTVAIALIQSFGIATFFSSVGSGGVNILVDGYSSSLFYFTSMITLVTGTIFIMWLGEQISDSGIGNGISLIIMTGILARLAQNIQTSFVSIQSGETTNYIAIIGMVVLMLFCLLFVVLISTGTRKIPVQYAKRVVGRKVYGGQATHIPLKLLTAGVMPIIFAQALMFVPGLLGSIFNSPSLTDFFDPLAWPYTIMFGILIIIFTYFYTAIAMNPIDVADNMKKQGGFIPGVRPGKATSEYIDYILSRITLPAAFFLALIAIFPTFLSKGIFGFTIDNISASFYGGTSILIVVGVALDTLQQIESHLIMRHYDGFMKTGKIKGRNKRRY